MFKYIKSDSSYNTYLATMSFGFLDDEIEEEVSGYKEDEAYEEAAAIARDYLEVDDIECIAEGDPDDDFDNNTYNVEVSWGGMIGYSSNYEVYAEDEDEAAEEAIGLALGDVEITLKRL